MLSELYVNIEKRKEGRMLSYFSSIGELLKNTEVHSNKDCYMPPILDRDPVFAANFLTIKDSEEVLEKLLEMYNSLREGSNKYPILKACVLKSFTNFKWFMDFTKELIKINDIGEFPVDLIKFCPKSNTREVFEIFPPLTYNKKKHRGVPLNFKSRVKDEIDMYRILYISQNYSLEDFRNGYPAWYSLGDTIVFENYNIRTNTRVRIIHRGGEFMYFLCGASDNWKEIRDVPLEMDYVVAALLFRDLEIST